MTAGLQVLRGDGVTLQIDETFSNIQFVYKGTIPATQDVGTGTNWRRGTLTISSNTALVAIRCSKPCYVTSSAINGSSITYNYWVNDGGATVEYWVYDYKYTPSGDNCGLQVLDSSNRLIFDSGNNYAICVADFNGTLPDAAIGTTNEQMDKGTTLTFAGKTVAVVQSSTPPWLNFVTLISENPGGGLNYFTTTAIPSVTTPTSSSVYFKSALWFNGVYGGAPPPSSNSPYGYLIFDVTGL